MSAAVKAGIGAAAAFVGWKFVDGKYGISKELGTLIPAASLGKKVKRLAAQPDANFIMLWCETMQIPGIRDSVALIQAETGRKMTFGELDELSNRIGNWVVSQGVKKGECLAFIMENRPEYIATWIGFAKAGVEGALINTNLKGKPLVHAMTVAKSVGCIFGIEHSEVVEASLAELRSGGLNFFASFGQGSKVGTQKPAFAEVSLDSALPTVAATPVDESRRKPNSVTSPLFYIYTSGTTGLPKACNMSHAKIMMMGSLCAMAKVKKGDAVYGSGLPLYHTAANLGVIHCLAEGSTYVIRTKFSASNHWEDCAKYNCVAMQYIGELCRYLLTQSNAADAKKHNVRIAFGNGLRPEIWDQFQRQLNIPEILEFYGATEGAGAVFNYCQNYEGQGAVGWQGPLMKMMFPTKIVKFDVENEVPIRDSKTGFCAEVTPGEPGELINPIKSITKTADGEMTNFEGYTNKEATEKKLLRDVFAKGDLWYRSGDLLRKDDKGYYYFVDRIGDTFRWKGENVSTMEVSEVLSSFEGVVDANVYGVQVPGKDGRACMVALTLESGKTLDPTTFATYCRANLPTYSVPVFIRFLKEEINLTGTFKHQKVDYRNQGCDPSKITDDVWWFNLESGTYEPYNGEIFSKISAGQSKL